MVKAQGFVDKAQGFVDKAQGFMHKAQGKLAPSPPLPCLVHLLMKKCKCFGILWVGGFFSKVEAAALPENARPGAAEP